MSSTKDSCFEEILERYKNKYILLSYFYAREAPIKTVYMYKTYLNLEDPLNTVYIFLVRNKNKFKTIVGNIHNYEDFDSGSSSFGYYHKTLEKNEYDTFKEAAQNFFKNLPHHYHFKVEQTESGENVYIEKGDYLNCPEYEKYSDIFWMLNASVESTFVESFKNYIS